ncbi:MAG: efflux RND transporter periplasmic adaptor subunit [Salinisphaeraceae bacterium]
MNKWIIAAWAGALLLPISSVFADSESDAEHVEEQPLRMSPAQRQEQGIETAAVGRRALTGTITAPGEVRINAYQSAQITPRVSAQVAARHARLGDEVKQGQPLVTLTSVEVGVAQADLIETDGEWQRVKRLGKQVVSDRRYVEAQVARQRAYAALRAYGMNETQINALLQGADASRATGEFELFSPQDGRVIRDDFVRGEYVEPGHVLFEVTDTSAPWVQAQLDPAVVARLAVGTPARVSRDGREWIDGRIVQLHYSLNTDTRTRAVRIEIKPGAIAFAAGEYVDVELQTAGEDAALAVPTDALVLMNGAQTVFTLKGDEFAPRPVVTGATRGGWTEIKSGLTRQDQIVTQGAFLLKSMALKSQIGDSD